MIAPRMSTALGETAQPQATNGSKCVQTVCREEPRIAREGAAPESLSLRQRGTRRRLMRASYGKHQTWRGDREAEGA